MSPESLSKSSLIFLALTLAVHEVALVRADLTLVGTYCVATSGNYTDGEAFQANLGQVVVNLTDDASGNAFFSNITAGKGGDRVFGLYYCNGVMDAADCSACVEAAAGEIQDSCTTKEALVWYLECTLRYANRDIFSKAELSPYAHLSLNQNVSNKTTFSDVLATTVAGVTKEATVNTTGKPPAYAAAQANLSLTESLVAVAQCTPDILGPACTTCLNAAVANMTSCCSDAVGAMVFLPSCQLLYTVSSATSNSFAAVPSSHSNPFSSTTKPSSANGTSKGSLLKSRGNVIAGVSAAIGFLMFVSLNITF